MGYVKEANKFLSIAGQYKTYDAEDFTKKAYQLSISEMLIFDVFLCHFLYSPARALNLVQFCLALFDGTIRIFVFFMVAASGLLFFLQSPTWVIKIKDVLTQGSFIFSGLPSTS